MHRNGNGGGEIERNGVTNSREPNGSADIVERLESRRRESMRSGAIKGGPSRVSRVGGG